MPSKTTKQDGLQVKSFNVGDDPGEKYARTSFSLKLPALKEPGIPLKHHIGWLRGEFWRNLMVALG